VSARNSSNEIRLTRVYDAPVRAVWDAWTIPEQVEKWWGPRGFTLTTHSKELRVGGTWRYTMHGPDGVDYPNIATYYVVEPYEKLVYDHGATDETPPLFRVTVTFKEENGRTTMEMISTLASREAAQEIKKLIKRAGGNATWDRLAEYLAQTVTGKHCFVINRTFEAPIGRVFEMWATPEHLEKWVAAASTKLRFSPSESEPNSTLVAVAEDLLATVHLAEEAPGETRVTLTTEPRGNAMSTRVEAFVQARSLMTLSWTSSFDALESLLAPNSAG
jgi:uncharacterized protein YndB with AHSA1/START domain